MKKVVLIAFTLILVTGMFSAGLTEVFDTAKASSTIYKTAQLDLEKANLDYNKAKIEATNRKLELSGELSYYSGLSNYNASMKDYYGDIVDRVLDVYVEEINVKTADLQLKNAQITYDNNSELFNNGLISEDDLKSSELDVSDAQNNLESAKLNLETAKDNLKELYEGDYSQIEINIPTYEGIFVSDQEYLNNNYNLKLAQINVDISQYDLNNLPANASSYDKRITEITHQKNILTLQDSQDTLIEAHKTTKNSIETLYKNLKNLEERMSLTQSTYKDTMDRFNKGLVSELELNTANINYLTTQKNYYESVRSYIKAYINYVIDTGRSLEEVGL